jgi:hypothetical protein
MIILPHINFSIAVKGQMFSVVMRREFFALLLLLVSCTGGEKVPPGVLGQEEMVEVLTDLYLTEQRVSHLGIKQDSAIKVFGSLKTKVFEKTGVPDSVFRKSLEYYMDHPKQLEVIYTALVDSLNLKEQRTPMNQPE